MKPLNENPEVQDRIMRLRRRYGMAYGMTAGIAFAVASWGWHGYLLTTTHTYYPWLMLVIGSIFCAILGGISGWLTARLGSSLLGIIFWAAISVGFAWLAIALPLQINPALVTKLDPQLGSLLHYDSGENFLFRVGASLVWIMPFMLLVGVTQLPISESAVFSTSVFGKIGPLFLSILLMCISAIITDSLVDAHFRNAYYTLDTTIQFMVDNQNNENVAPDLMRQYHVRAFTEVNEQVQESRHLFVGSYDESLNEFHVLVKFNEQWVDCLVFYNNLSSCKLATGE